MAGSFASGNWIAREGNEDEFVSRWLEFLRWTQENADGFSEATLIRDNSDPRHFLSFAQWESEEAQQGWRSLPGFAEKFGACHELCEDFQGGGSPAQPRCRRSRAPRRKAVFRLPCRGRVKGGCSVAEAGASAHPLVSGAKPTTRLSSSRPVQQLETRLDAR
jgi:heme-degrading monooxygenase HmoA